MSTVVVPNDLRARTGGQERVEVDARDVRGVLRALEERFPGFREALGASFAVAIDGEVFPEPLLEPVTAASEIHFLPPVSGGR